MSPLITLCYAIVLPGRKLDFRAGFWLDCYRESTDIGRRPEGRCRCFPGSSPATIWLKTSSVSLAQRKEDRRSTVEQEGPWQGPNPLKGFAQQPILGVQTAFSLRDGASGEKRPFGPPKSGFENNFSKGCIPARRILYFSSGGRIFHCHEISLELVSGADFRWFPHHFSSLTCSRGSGGQVWPENSQKPKLKFRFLIT